MQESERILGAETTTAAGEETMQEESTKTSLVNMMVPTGTKANQTVSIATTKQNRINDFIQEALVLVQSVVLCQLLGVLLDH